MQKDRKIEKEVRRIAYPAGYPGAKEVAVRLAKGIGGNWELRGYG